MNHKRRILFAAACVAYSQAVWAQAAYPTKTIHFVVPFQAGGESDIVARQIANKLSVLRGYTVVVDNYPGAGGNLGAEKALREAPDGYTFLVISGAYAGNAVVSKPTFDPIAAIQPVIQFTRQESVLISSTKFKTLADLVDAAKKAPGKINFGSAGIGSLGHLSTENFAYNAGVKLNHIPYKGTSGAITDLAGGQTDMMLAGLTSARALAKTGQIRILAVGGTKRLADMPDVPTFAESGYPKFETNLWHGLVASKDVPVTVVSKINADINAVLRDPEIVARYSSENVMPIGGTPAQFKDTIRTDMERLRFIVKTADIKVQ